MKIKKTILAATTVLTLSVCSLQPVITSSASSQNFYIVEQDGSSVSPRSDCTRWVYNIENGKIYKRLFNCSTNSWIGDWIYVGEYAG